MRIFGKNSTETPRSAFLPFTLIEITLAIGIVAIGMAGIMALFPIGFNATRDAIGDNYSSDFADQFLHIIANQAKKPGPVGNEDQYWNLWIGSNGSAGLIDDSKPSDTDLDTATKGSQLPLGNIWYTNKKGVYYIESKSGAIVDFNAHVAVWKTSVKATVFEGAWKDWTAEYSQAAGLNVEISWPADKPYVARERKYYYLEIFKPQP